MKLCWGKAPKRSETMKKIVAMMGVVAIVGCIALCLVACTVTVGVTINSFTADEAATVVWETLFVEGTDWNEMFFDYDVDPKTYDEGTAPKRFGGIRLQLDGAVVGGYEFGCVQFYITADQDVEGYFDMTYQAETYIVECLKHYDYSLKAGEKTLMTIVFENNFIAKKKEGEFRIHFGQNANQHSDAFIYAVNTQYSISNFEFGLNE